MNKALTRKPEPSLYETDFAAWADEQARLLRAAAAGDADARTRVDWENVIEEIETLGRAERKEILSFLEIILVHLLKLGFSPARDPRRGWRRSVRAARARAQRALRESPSLKPFLVDPTTLAELYAEVRPVLADDLEEQDGLPPDSLPPACPYALQDILAEDWEPANRHGIADRA